MRYQGPNPLILLALLGAAVLIGSLLLTVVFPLMLSFSGFQVIGGGLCGFNIWLSILLSVGLTVLLNLGLRWLFRGPRKRKAKRKNEEPFLPWRSDDRDEEDDNEDSDSSGQIHYF